MYKIKDIQRLLSEWQEEETAETTEKCFVLFSIEKGKGGAILTSFYRGEDENLVEGLANIFSKAEKHLLDIMARASTEAMLLRCNKASEE